NGIAGITEGGTLALPALSFVDLGTGFSAVGTPFDTLNVSVASTKVMGLNPTLLTFLTDGVTRLTIANTYIGSTVQVRLPSGTSSNLSLAFTADTTTGMYLAAAGNMQFWAGSVLGMAVRTDRINMPIVPSSTTGSAANMWINGADGWVYMSTSARKYKTNIKYDEPLADMVLKPATFHRDDDDKDFIGFVADDLAEQDTRIGTFDEQGEIENYDVRAVVAILAAKVNRLENA
ncbi:unnamed protein product, partial [marine sediment metagenome]